MPKISKNLLSPNEDRRPRNAVAGATGDQDMVNAPAHYVKGRRFEPIEVIEDWVFDNWNLSNVLKYVSRAGRKGSALEDLKKAAFYLDREILRVQR